MAEALTLSKPLDRLRRLYLRAKTRASTIVRAYPRESIGAGVLGLVLTAALGATTTSGFNDRAHAAPPSPPPLVMRDLAPAQALKVNAAMPVADGPNPAALPFHFSGNAASRAQALQCLTSAVYYEAGSQDENGERAVAQVVLNRVRHPAFPSTVCGVVYEGSTRNTGCQFTFTCDGSMNRQPDAAGWTRAARVAEAALSGSVYAPVGWATHYHADYVVPYWAASMAKSAVVGAHLFYRWGGAWGQPAIFTRANSGREPNALALRNAALSAVHVSPLREASLAEAIEEIPGAEPIKLAPSMRGDKRVAVRFNLAAREAANEVVHEDYTKKFEASDNLKWSLSDDSTGATQPPLGKAPAPAAPAAGTPAASATP